MSNTQVIVEFIMPSIYAAAAGGFVWAVMSARMKLAKGAFQAMEDTLESRLNRAEAAHQTFRTLADKTIEDANAQIAALTNERDELQEDAHKWRNKVAKDREYERTRRIRKRGSGAAQKKAENA